MTGNKFDWEKLGNRIAEMRIEKGITQQQLAELTGLSVVYIGYIEQGKRHGTLTTYLDIVNILGYTLNDLVIYGPTEMDPSPYLSEVASVLSICKNGERETLLRIIRELAEMVRQFHENDQ